MPKQVVPPSTRRKLLAIYKNYSEVVDKIAYEGDVKASCKKGCSHCCHMLTAVSMLEGAVLAENIMLRADWREIASRTRADALVITEHWKDRAAYLKAYSPCPILNPETKECLLYERRPSVCRFHYVVSDPSACEPGQTNEISAFDFTMPEARVFRFCTIASGEEVPIVAPISLLLLHWLPQLAKNEEDHKFLSELSEGTMSAEEFSARSLNEESLRDNTPEMKAAIHDSFTKAFSEP